MEKSELETPKPSQNPPFKFPSHRRRPLRSKTLCSLIRILSHCHQDLQRSCAVLHEPDNGGNEVEQVSTVQCDQLVGHHDLGPEEALLHEESLVDENRELRSSVDPGFTKEHMEIDGLNPTDIVKGNGDLGNPDFVGNVKNVNSVEDTNQNNNDFSALRVDQEDQFSFPDFNMEEFGSAKQLCEKAPSIREVLETIDSFIDTAGSSKDIENKEEKSSPLERIESEMQHKGRESKELVSASCVMHSAPHRRTAEDIEDGEISGDKGFYEKSMNFLHEDVVSLEKKSVDKVRASVDINHKEEFSRNERQREFEKDKQSDLPSMNTINHMDNAMEVELRKDNRNLVENRSKLVFYGDIIEDKTADGKNSRREIRRIKKQGSRPKETSSPASCSKNIALGGESSGGNAMENQCSASTEKDAGVNNKKRKRGPKTEERKDKKKKEERMKRAEKNRQLGVKRLKLQPVLKPKTVTYCRHYLKGRCHEGEKCKFSHDTIPLTKSKPCRHFARQSCMKGDDCPFNHQLSKYPCKNYLSQGSCSRGADCMFSHELPVKEASPIASDVGKPELKSVSTNGNLNFKKQMNPNGTSHQNVSAKLYSSGISSCKNKEKNVTETTPRQAPKGISFLSHGKSSAGNTRAALSPKADYGVKVGHQIINGVPNVAQNLNENTKKTPAVTPRGINFLSYGKAPLGDSSSNKKSSSFSFISNLEIGKSPPSSSSKNEQAGSSAKSDNGVKVDSQTGQGASCRTPVVAPRGVNLLSDGNPQMDSSVNKKKQAGFGFKEDNTVPLTVQERASMANKFQIPNSVQPQLLSSSSLPYGQYMDQLVDVQTKSTPSSSQGPLLSSTPSSVQRALRSTLAFAAKFQSEVKKDRSYGSPAVGTDFSKEASSSSQNKSMKNASAILDFLYGANGKSNQ